jgi:Mn2+/Fe2+ NRAMP family transporter
LIWSFLVGLALMSACGATVHAMLPLMSPQSDKILYGIIQSAVAVFLVSLGGYKLFEKVMTVCIGVMFFVVVCTAAALHPPLDETLSGLFLPMIPELHNGGLDWTVALLGGVGGTLTVLCYGYWIREEGREGTDDLKICRIDLATGYVMTALFGMSMLVIGSHMPAIEGGGASLLADLANGLQEPFGRFGPAVRWAFLFGAWGAVFSSLLGVWQSMPYLFADFCNLLKSNDPQHEKLSVNTASWAYRGFLYGIATIPALGLWLVSFQTAQKTYAVVGALIIPALAVILLVLNNRTSLVGQEFRNRWATNLILSLALLFFLYSGWIGIRAKL